VKCRSCGADIKSNSDLSVAFEFYYHINEKKPKSVILHLLCQRCGTEIKKLEKDGEEGLKIFRKVKTV